jgi:hypothetical protein
MDRNSPIHNNEKFAVDRIFRISTKALSMMESQDIYDYSSTALARQICSSDLEHGIFRRIIQGQLYHSKWQILVMGMKDVESEISKLDNLWIDLGLKNTQEDANTSECESIGFVPVAEESDVGESEEEPFELSESKHSFVKKEEDADLDDSVTAVTSFDATANPDDLQPDPTLKQGTHICNRLKFTLAFAYSHPETFLPQRNGRNHHGQSNTVVVLRRPQMDTLCRIKGVLEGGKNVKWTDFIVLVESLRGNVKQTGGSTSTVYIPTTMAYPIRVDEPHPSTRLGKKLLFSIRNILFSKFNIDMDAFIGID